MLRPATAGRSITWEEISLGGHVETADYPRKMTPHLFCGTNP